MVVVLLEIAPANLSLDYYRQWRWYATALDHPAILREILHSRSSIDFAAASMEKCNVEPFRHMHKFKVQQFKAKVQGGAGDR
jgi:hypothetical protein